MHRGLAWDARTRIYRISEVRPLAVDLHLQVSRSTDNRLSGTVRLPDGRHAHAFSGTLELMRVFEELVPPGLDEVAADSSESAAS